MMSIEQSLEVKGLSKQQVWRLWEMLCNVLLAVLFFQFVIRAGSGLMESFRISTLLITVKITADATFFLIRKRANEVSTVPYDWVVAVLGTFVPFLFLTIAGQDHLTWQLVQILGAGMQLSGILSLNRSVGLVAANRGIKTSGMYRVVRHPLYLAYVISYFGFLMNQTTFHNIVIYCAMVTFLFLRILAEERLLTRSEEYQEYCKKVRWRLIPFVL